ncbi:transcription termination factor MTERF4, chloroplastic isoform X3 [Magnolia sinica]|uniref:transcription termination factor MTERF4, chloroplastic isoform X3 n=1 Tax=Magnolia sinica TaxID=86752 RepID=UPI002657B2DF|nr:transcription termination factor MTERF4, chloroplastic isoform X3 [Magnolia sinica]
MSASILQTPKIPQKSNPLFSKLSPIRSHFLPKHHLSPKSPLLSLNLPFLPTRFPISTRLRVTPDELVPDSPLNSAEEEEEDAREAVSQILQEEGVSKEEAALIASNSPNYVRMLIDGVHELDEASLWDSWKGGRVGEEDDDERRSGSLSFKEKVYYMGKEKGDRGILPFLESVGLSTSGSSHVARYLSSERLPDLINKMEARRGGLDMLDSADASFPYLVESFPRLLLLSVESHFKPLVEFLEAAGVPKGRIRSIFLSFPPIVFYNIEKDIKPKIQALEKVGVEDKDIGRVVVKYPWVLSTSIQENYEKVFSFFNAEKVPKMSIDRAIRSWPHLLGCSTSKMKTMVDQFAELGVKNKKLGQVIAASPQLLLQKPNEFLEVVSYIEELGFDKESIGRILSRCPEIFASSVENTLKKKLNLLIEFGIYRNNLPRVIRKYPELLVSDVNNTLLPRRFVKARPSPLTATFANLLCVCGTSGLCFRMKYLMKIGLSKREVASMVNRFSPLLGYSIEEVLKPKLDFLVCTMNKPVRDVVEYPRYFSYSLEKKIKPRFWVLKGRNLECSLKDMLGKNDEDFAADYMGIGRMLVPPITVDDC